MSDLTIERIKELQQKLHEGKPAVVGVVFRGDLRNWLEENVPQPEAEFPGDEFARYSGLPIYFDAWQEAECIAFYDELLLRAYLQRMEKPIDYARALVVIFNGKRDV